RLYSGRRNYLMKITKRKIKEYLDRLESPEGCNFKDGVNGLTWRCNGGTDKSYSIAILKDMKFSPVQIDEILQVAEEGGGFCDCEVLFNAIETLEDYWK
ncbi:MAG TPA: DUF2695 domain-containing protein, partial [Nitrososphaeraceae archaeon]